MLSISTITVAPAVINPAGAASTSIPYASAAVFAWHGIVDDELTTIALGQ